MIKDSKITIAVTVLMLLAVFFVACDNSQKELQAEVDEFNSWMEEKQNDVEEAVDQTWEETKESWEDVEQEYDETITELDARTEEMSEETREEYMEIKNEFREWQNEMRAEIRKQEGISKVEVILMVEGPDDELDQVTADNLVEKYRSFVNTVEEYKDDYTAKEWAIVESYWEMLNNRKNEVEDDITTEENAEIAQLKLEYAGIKTIYKTGAKMESK